MPPITTPTPLDDTDLRNRDLLDDLQCNILSSNDRPNTHYFFLTFSSADQARRALSSLASGNHCTTSNLALESEWESRERRRVKAALPTAVRHDPVPGFSASLMLTARCYADFFPGFMPSDPAFQARMARRDNTLRDAARLNDPEHLRRESGVHALYAVGYDAQAVAWSQVEQAIRGRLAALGVVVHEEQGYVLRHSSQGRVNAIEPFGYRDAISQPLFYQQDLAAAVRNQGAAATVAGGSWSSFARLSLVLVPDPHGRSPEPHGTYVAYRKLRQKVDLFYEQAARLAASAPAPALAPNDVADGLIGRRIDGTPLDGGANLNDFIYPHNSVCPAHAHARKVNPRKDSWARERRIVRRSTVYGPELLRDRAGRPILPTRSDRELRPDVGLLFFACQADINAQFEFIQALWANDMTSGADTVIAQLPRGVQNRISLNGSGSTLAYDPVVDLLAGDYFFVPSISFFSSL